MTTHTSTSHTIGRKFVSAIAAVCLFGSISVFAEEPACKSKGGEIKVVYPELARRMKITGVVRLQLQLSSSGSVREIKVLGGNPILVSAAQQAVKQARYESSDPCIAQFNFKD